MVISLMLVKETTNVLGIVGVVLVLWTYLYLQLGKMPANGFMYSFINLIGSLLIITSLFTHFNLASFMIEIAWTLISLFGIYKFIERTKEKKHVGNS